MLLAFLKLGDIGARSLFVLIVLYSLPVEAAGQFGLVMTVLAFWSFFSGFERYLDIQRKLAGELNSGPDNIILENLRFYGFNLLLLSPIVVILLKYWIDLDYIHIALLPVIAFAEHQSAEIYRYALIVPHYRALLWITLARGLVLLSAISVPTFVFEHVLSLDIVITVWVVVSAVFMLIGVVCFIKRSENLRIKEMPPFWEGLRAQFKASRVHFLIGLLALLSLQADRLIVGSLLSLEQTGIYFRHVFLAMSVYQIITVVSYHRILSGVYRAIQAGEFPRARKIIHAEIWKVLPLGMALVIVVWLIGFDAIFENLQMQKLMPSVLAGLLLAIVFRVLADYNSIVLNAFHCERYIFRAQGGSLVITIAMNLLLTWVYGLEGTVAAVLAGAVIYFAGTTLYVSKRYVMAEDSRRE